jgi:curli biogenesis system outer membrane secretion channel CsgG
MARRVIFVLALLVSGISAGCGYALAGRGSFLPDYIREVGIPQLENKTTFFQIEQVLTEKIRAEFIGRGKYAVRPESTGADAVLTGEIIGMSVQPVGFTEQQLASRYLITMTMRVSFTDVRTGEVLWSDDALTFRSEYELTQRGATAAQGETFLDQERSSFDRISGDIARSVVTAILEAF